MCGFQFVDIAVNQSRIDDLFKMVENGVDRAHGLSQFCQQLRGRVGGKMSVLVIPEQWVRLCFMV